MLAFIVIQEYKLYRFKPGDLEQSWTYHLLDYFKTICCWLKSEGNNILGSGGCHQKHCSNETAQKVYNG